MPARAPVWCWPSFPRTPISMPPCAAFPPSPPRPRSSPPPRLARDRRQRQGDGADQQAGLAPGHGFRGPAVVGPGEREDEDDGGALQGELAERRREHPAIIPDCSPGYEIRRLEKDGPVKDTCSRIAHQRACRPAGTIWGTSPARAQVIARSFSRAASRWRRARSAAASRTGPKPRTSPGQLASAWAAGPPWPAWSSRSRSAS